MGSKVKILCADGFSKAGLEILSYYENISVTVNEKTSKEELISQIPDYDVLVVRSATKVDKDVIDASKKLKIIARAGVGLDTIDVNYATQKGIIVMNSPTGNVISTAEHALALLFSIARKIPFAHISTVNGGWDRKSFRGVELYRKKIGIVGLGKIGTEVAKRCIALGMEVLAYDPFVTDERASQLGVKLCSLEEIYKESDFITFHVPLSEQTKNMVTKKEIEMMKPSVRIINCARGGIINEKDLADALNSGRIAGAAIDVFSTEPPVNNPLIGAKNCIVVPHLGASTEEAQENVSIEIAESIIKFFKDEVIINAVNMPSISLQKYKELKSFIDMGETVGKIISQLSDGGVLQIVVSYSGHIVEDPVQIITRAVAKGFMEKIVGDETVNFVNSLLYLEARGIKLTETKEDEAFSVFSNLIKVSLITKTKKVEIWYTVYPNNDAKIVRIDNYYLELNPTENMLFVRNYDKPGVIGFLGVVLGDAGINIGEMKVTRARRGEKALTIITLDSEAPKEILDKISSHPDIIEVRKVTL
ncbi:MAG: phosphoglycerate dehydrogenase [Spirochaetia bacterium]|nr:phosphoglycerate dehydrogenase [Spirochaetota bacterium]MDW8112508.1 phosphoglycerate dehydrogenase [Spirochaetia bacterium]